ncbi:MAG: RDD family protein [Acidobacteria bacterium]|nr:RDD family protein [Acidobacteriota bacterium]
MTEEIPPSGMPTQTSEAPVIVKGYELAGPGSRFMAALIDGVLCGAVWAAPVVGILVSLAYGLTKDALPFLNGQSIGKKAMRIRVVRETTQQPITGDFTTAVIRQVSLMIPLFNIVDACMVFSESRNRRRFGDRWAKTLVIRDPAP